MQVSYLNILLCAKHGCMLCVCVCVFYTRYKQADEEIIERLVMKDPVSPKVRTLELDLVEYHHLSWQTRAKKSKYGEMRVKANKKKRKWMCKGRNGLVGSAFERSGRTVRLFLNVSLENGKTPI